jgi:Putative zinc- or iron-chelating domain
MESEEIYRALATVLKRSADAEERSAEAAAGLLATVDLLIDILAGRGVINEGHLRLLAKARERARPERPRVRLRTLVDKYEQPVSPVDCESRVHLCQARCCTFSVELSRQDLEEGGLLWDIDQPYLLRREADGFCSHLDRATKACGVYQNRPAACRTYDCRTDQRIWIDFDKRIAAPVPERS